MDSGEVFGKTAKGHDEIRTRACRLDARHRALLIVVDGHRNVQALAGMAGGGDIGQMLGRLLEAGLIEPVRQNATQATATPAPSAPATSATGWMSIRDAARDLVLDLLGPDGEFLAMKLEGVRSADQLAPVLAGVRQAVAELRGPRALSRLDHIIADTPLH